MTEDRFRVVHIASGREWRGGQRQVVLLTRALASQGCRQVVVTARHSRLAEELVRAGIETVAVDWPRALALAPLRAAWREARQAPSLFHAHDGHAVTLAAWAARASGRPWIAHRRTVFPVRHPRRWRRATRVIAVAEAVVAPLRAAGLDPARIVVVPSATDPEAARRAAPRNLRAELGLPPNVPLAANVAALTEEKDHDTLIRAAQVAMTRRPDLHWVVAGDGPLRAHLERLIGNLGVGSRIHLLGWVDEPLGLIKAADVFVLSSRQEALGTVLLDAMAAGTPVVATEAGGVADTVRGGGLLVPVGRPEPLAEAVIRVLTSGELRHRLAAGASLAIAGRDPAGMAEAVRAVYRSVVLKH